MTDKAQQLKRGYIRKKCSRCGEDLCYQEGDPCDACMDKSFEEVMGFPPPKES